MDLPGIAVDTSQGFGLARVWGISVAEIAQANNLNPIITSNSIKYKNIEIYGGMQKGLPLANPAQAGLLYSGVISQAFGNWVGRDMTLDFVCQPGGQIGSSKTGGIGSVINPKNFSLDWPANTPLSQALQNCLKAAFPGYTVNINISSNIVRPNREPHYAPTIEQLGQYCRQTSLDIVKTQGYSGVSITVQGTTINISDNSSSSGNPIQINFQDLIGQPTWIESPNIQLKTVMRGDLKIGSQIMLPQTIVQNTSQANSYIINQKATFQGGFYVISVRHVGNFREPSGEAWVTIIEASPLKPVTYPAVTD